MAMEEPREADKNEPEKVPRPERDGFGDFDARLKRVRETRAGPATGERDQRQVRGKFGPGIQVGIELLAGVAGGALMGWGLDRWLETSPLFFLIFFFLGAGAGMLNAWRYLRRFASPDDTGSNSAD